MKRITTRLYRAARTANDIETVASGDPNKIARRIRNKVKGRLLTRVGVWRRLWK